MSAAVPRSPQVMQAAPTENALTALLRAQAGRLPYVYLESETRVALTWLADYLAGRLPAARWIAARAFGATLEIRWRRDDLTVEAQALYEDTLIAPALNGAPIDWTASRWTALLDPVTQPRDVLLLGEPTRALPPDHPLAAADGWLSDAAGQRLTYPVPNRAARVVLRCQDYTVGGVVALTRLCDVVPYQAAGP